MLAFYSRPYKVVDYNQLAIMTDLAGYYCALPVLSVSLSGAFSSVFIKEIPGKSVDLLPLAAQLHHAVLFRECMIQVVGCCTTCRFGAIEDDKLRKLAEAISNTLSTKIAGAHLGILIQVGRSQGHKIANMQSCISFNTKVIEIAREVFGLLRSDGTLPEYFRKISVSMGVGSFPLITSLLRNELTLDPEAGLNSAGVVGKYVDYLLCTTVDDEDLPWDINATDF